MEIVFLLINTTVDALISIGRMALILVPVLILIEIARAYQVIEKITGKVKGALQFLTLPQEAAFPMLAGIFFGIVFGAALIIEYSREGFLNKRDLLLIGIFLSICHSVVEDTFIFAVFGANPLVLLPARIVLAIIITRAAASIIDRYSLKQA